MRIILTPLVVITWIFRCAQSQWVPEAYTIPNQVLALSPDGTVAISSAGIYTQTSGSWTLTQSLSFLYNSPYLDGVKFLRSDGSVFAVSNYSYTLGPYINVYQTVSSGIWTRSSTLYATSLGYDINGVSIVLEAVTADGNTLIVVLAFDLIVLQNNGTDFVFKQKLETRPLVGLIDASVSADGSTLVAYYSEDLLFFSQKSDGSYELTDEHSGIQWSQMALSSNGQIIVGSYFNDNTNLAQIHFFFKN